MPGGRSPCRCVPRLCGPLPVQQQSRAPLFEICHLHVLCATRRPVPCLHQDFQTGLHAKFWLSPKLRKKYIFDFLPEKAEFAWDAFFSDLEWTHFL